MGEGVENEKETGVYLTRERKNGAMKQFEFLKIFFKEQGERLCCECILKKGVNKYSLSRFYGKKLIKLSLQNIAFLRVKRTQFLVRTNPTGGSLIDRLLSHKKNH